MFELGDHMANNDSTTVPIHKLPPRKKVKQPIEDHFDDCGSDFTPLELPDSEPEDQHTTHAFGHIYDDTTTYTHNEHIDNNDSLDSLFLLHYLKGSDTSLDEHPPPPNHKPVKDVLQLLVFLKAQKHKIASVDVVEICGGAAGVIRLCARFHLT